MNLKFFYMFAVLITFALNVQLSHHLYPRNNEFPKVFPHTLEEKPNLHSPLTTEYGKEIIIAFLRDSQKFTLVPVTVENGKPLLYSRKIMSLFGKDRQLEVDSRDFPELARSGLHSEAHLENLKSITGLSIDLINTTGRPGGYSNCGFLAQDEDIISVLKQDNQLVRMLGLTHPRMARPLFQVWNMILEEIKAGKLKRFSGIDYFLYNGNKINLKAEATKGWQNSIFNDEIQGKFDIRISRELSPGEKNYLAGHYTGLSEKQMIELQNKLSSIHISEMVPFYIMRYGFYEGHTDFRADPIAIAFIFGLKSLEEIDQIFEAKLYSLITTHFIGKSM